jgi:NADPH:quinone reductase-like Zn-dependent oxidoreductase
VAPASQVAVKPATLSFVEAAASVMSGLTALLAMRDVARVGPGTRVLINGASGGVGTFAVQIAYTMGADVTGVCSTANIDLVRSLGADHVIDYTRQDFTRGPQRYDVILDSDEPLADRDRQRAESHRSADPEQRRFEPRGCGSAANGARRTARPRSQTGAVHNVHREHLSALATLLVSGDVQTVIDATYPLHEAARAVAHMVTHRARGNIAIEV